MTDVVYLLGGGSNWKNNEIRYSLRSVEKHLSGVGNVYCIGHCPDFLQDVTHISAADQVGNLVKALNIKNKIERACNEESISDPFLAFSDDYFLNRDYPANQYPYFYRGELEKGAATLGATELYRRVYGNTIKVLRDNKLLEKHFNVHAPILYRKAEAKMAFSLADWNTQLGFMSKSLYCNFLAIEGGLQEDCKISERLTKEQIEKIIEGKPFFTISDRALFRGKELHAPLVEVLESLYPNKSRWEK